MIDKLKLALPDEAELKKVRETRYTYVLSVSLIGTNLIFSYTFLKCFDPTREELAINDAVNTIMANLYFRAGNMDKVRYYLSRL